jgi:rhamnogalacturonyl hydrolase YesR
MSTMGTCPRCGSTAPHLHPAVQFEGEVELCTDNFHLQPTNQNSQQVIDQVLAKRGAAENRWRWRVEGAGVKSGTTEHPYEETGEIETEHAGDALDWLIHRGPMWDCMDTSRPFTITIETVQ